MILASTLLVHYMSGHAEPECRMKVSHKRVAVPGAVIIGSLSPKTRSRLAKVVPGNLSVAPNDPATIVVEARSGDPRQLCATLNEVVGGEGVVAPILQDAEGHRLLPTGRLRVQFKEQPTVKELRAFAARHDVELVARNKWSARQADYALRSDDSRYLPDITAALESDRMVEAAWPDTRARFSRESA